MDGRWRLLRSNWLLGSQPCFNEQMLSDERFSQLARYLNSHTLFRHMDHFDEQSLVEQAQHDPAAFGPLYDRYVERIYSFIFHRTGNRQIAEDITAATFESALRSIKKFQWRGRGISAWLYRICRNKLIGHYRRQRFTTSLRALMERGFQPRMHGDFTEEFETNDWLIDAYSQLDVNDREVIALRFFEDLSSDEVAHILKCSKDRLYLRLHRALDRLRKKLEKANESHEVANE